MRGMHKPTRRLRQGDSAQPPARLPGPRTAAALQMRNVLLHAVQVTGRAGARHEAGREPIHEACSLLVTEGRLWGGQPGARQADRALQAPTERREHDALPRRHARTPQLHCVQQRAQGLLLHVDG